jgi:hypothetical protein
MNIYYRVIFNLSAFLESGIFRSYTVHICRKMLKSFWNLNLNHRELKIEYIKTTTILKAIKASEITKCSAFRGIEEFQRYYSYDSSSTKYSIVIISR